VNVLSEKDRGSMFLELDKTIKELNVVLQQLHQARSLFGDLSMSIAEGKYDKAKAAIEKPETEIVFQKNKVVQLLEKAMELKSMRDNLEKQLGAKIIEKE
jgi:hypothetical protein